MEIGATIKKLRTDRHIIWIFTGVTLIVEGVFDAAVLIMGYLRADKADKKETPQKD